MITSVIKRDGRVVPFSPGQLNGWGSWAAENIGNLVDWSTVVMRTVASLPDTCKTTELHEALIRQCLNMNTWSHYRMAGRLYASDMHKAIYGKGTIPTIQQVHQNLADVGYMAKLDYSDEEYAEIEHFIKHDRDFRYPHFQLDQLRMKYALRNRLTGEEYESPQFTYMRMAMALAEDQPKDRRIHDVKMWYNHFSLNRSNAPTPNYVNLGTHLNGYASCCLLVADDTALSLGVAEHIAYMMTVMSAGIGTNYNCRSIGDPVRGGLISHSGKLPYYRSLVGSVRANMQNGRAGACTTHYSAYDPEVETLMRLKNPMSVEDKKIRGMDYSQISNKFLGRKAAKNEDVFLFNIYTAPDLVRAMYGKDPAEFERLYIQYENDPNFKKTYVSAREIILTAHNEGYETGRAYLSFIDEMNRHTPFRDPMHSSNLCVAGDTLLTIKSGENIEQVPIDSLVGQTVELWNGRGWSASYVDKTSPGAKLYEVTLSNGKSLRCTAAHKWYIFDAEEDRVDEVRTLDLQPGETLQSWIDPETHATVFVEVVSVKFDGMEPTYCVNEPIRHKAMFNGIVTGQCQEIALPTAGYADMEDLYTASDVGHIALRFNDEDDTRIFNAADKVKVYRDGKQLWRAAQELDNGDIVTYVDRRNVEYDMGIVTEVADRKIEPEVAICTLGGIVVTNIDNDEQYESAMYYTLLMADKCIHKSDYVLPHVGFTAKNRLSVGIGIMDLAHHMARKKLSFMSPEGKAELHRVAERHAYFAIKCALRLGKELGNAPWIHRTEWANGWLPIDTYNRNVDAVAKPEYVYDWEALRQEIIANGGIRYSAVLAFMPGESSSKGAGVCNAIYPVRETTLLKTDNNRTSYWAAPDGDRLQAYYESAWDIPYKDMVDLYAIFQKFTDQGISADFYRRIEGDDKVTTEEMLQNHFYMLKMGIKTRYYMNTKTSKAAPMEHSDKGPDVELISQLMEHYGTWIAPEKVSDCIDELLSKEPDGMLNGNELFDLITKNYTAEQLQDVSEEAGCGSGGCTL